MIDGTSGNDSLDGTGGDDTINGFAGNDTLNGLGGNDSLDGGDGVDVLDGGDDNDILNGGAGNDTHTGGAGSDNFLFNPISATGDVDVITDFALGDFITIGDTGSSNKDPGADLITFIGTAAFSNSAGEVRYSTSGGETLIEVDVDGDGAADQSIQITNGEFTLRTTINNGPTLEIDGAFGATTAGDDTIVGTSGFDSISGGDGNDFLRGMGGGDIINGGDGDDTISENAGNDFIDGGAGTDQLNRFYGEQIDLLINDFTMTNALSNEADTFLSIERIFVSNRLAPASDDTIDGSASTIELNLHGGGGDDIIIGGENDDNVEGDSGDDTLTGGIGADTFDFDYIGEVGTTGDVITDLELSDRIDFSLINTLGEALDPDGLDLTFIGEAAFSSTVGEFRFVRSGGQTQIQFDEDGDGTADRFVTITAGEFILAETFSDSAVLQISAAASATAGADSLVGSNGDDTIDGLAGNDTIQGLFGNDSLIGGDDSDLIEGGGGNDTLVGGAGADTLQGGDDDDTADYSASATGVQVDLDGATNSMGDAQGDVLSSIERVVGSAFDDTLVGLSGNDTLIGGDGADQLSGLGGDDGIDGGEGADSIDGGAGADTIIGGAGDDTLSYANSAAVSVDLGTGTGSGGDAQGDSISGVENVFGSGVGNDTLIGDSGGNHLRGLGGDDSLNGAGGNDSLEGGDDADTLKGDSGNDTLEGDDGADSLEGGIGVDLVRGGEGNDTLRGNPLGAVDAGGNTLDGGAGIDRAIINTGNGFANDVVFVNDDNPSAGVGYSTTISGVTGLQSLVDIEIVEFREGIEVASRIFELSLGATTNDLLTASLGLNFDAYGGAGNDTLVGGIGDDSLDAGVGDDSLAGGDGVDTLVGGAGVDTLTGGSDGDLFIVETSAGAGLDAEIITDFAIDDRLALFDSGGAQTFVRDGVFTATAGEYKFVNGGGQTQIQIDTDGNGAADSFINLSNGEFFLRETSDGSNILMISVASAGDDFLFGTSGSDIIDGLAGNDTIEGFQDADTLIGGAGADLLDGGSGVDTASYAAASGGVTVRLSNGTANGFEAEGDVLSSIEVLTGSDFADRFVGSNNADTLFGGAGNDTITTGNGGDVVFGGDNNDRIKGGNGGDTLRGDDGDDRLFGRDGNDRIFGGAGNDALFGNANADILNGEDGDDAFRGLGGNDRLNGGVGADSLLGHTGRDILHGNEDNDILDAGEADDQLFGDDGNDTLFGRDGDDVLEGGDGDDQLFGNLGLDTLTGGLGNDTVTGNGGNDVFVFALGDGNDTFNAFTEGPGVRDVISLMGFGAAFDTFVEVFAAATDDGLGNTVIDFGGGDSITLIGDLKTDLDADDFVFV